MAGNTWISELPPPSPELLSGLESEIVGAPREAHMEAMETRANTDSVRDQEYV